MEDIQMEQRQFPGFLETKCLPQCRGVLVHEGNDRFRRFSPAIGS